VRRVAHRAGYRDEYAPQGARHLGWSVRWGGPPGADSVFSGHRNAGTEEQALVSVASARRRDRRCLAATSAGSRCRIGRWKRSTGRLILGPSPQAERPQPQVFSHPNLLIRATVAANTAVNVYAALVPFSKSSADHGPRVSRQCAAVSVYLRFIVRAGWDETGRPGSIRYSLADLSAFADAAGVLLYVGPLTAVRRLSLLLRACARVRARLGPVAPLIIWGGHPGEWEGEPPYQ
jgi:hypothetical protein